MNLKMEDKDSKSVFREVWFGKIQDRLTDLEIVCKDGSFWVHRPLFKFMQSSFGIEYQDLKETEVFLVPDVASIQMEAVLENLYNDVVNEFVSIFTSGFKLEYSDVVDSDAVKQEPESFSSDKYDGIPDLDNPNDDPNYEPFNSFESISATNGAAQNNIDEERYVDDPIIYGAIKKIKLEIAKSLEDPGNENTCSLCGKNFQTGRFLRRHLKGHLPMETRALGCKFCDKRFENKSKLESHVRSLHTTEKPEACNMCEKTFKTLMDLTKHLRFHGIGEDFVCDIEGCEASFKYKQVLTKHKQEVHSVEVEHLSCKICCKSFENYRKFQYHMRQKHPSDMQIKKIVSNKMKYECELCQKPCATASILKLHMRKHSNEKPFSCDQCGQTFKYKLSLNYHLKAHAGIKMFTCEKCGKEFSSKHALTWHLNIHTGLKPYCCTFCGKRFAQEPNHRQHEKRHVDGTFVEPKKYVQNFKCTLCDKAYAGPRGLRRHKAEVHRPGGIKYEKSPYPN